MSPANRQILVRSCSIASGLAERLDPVDDVASMTASQEQSWSWSWSYLKLELELSEAGAT